MNELENEAVEEIIEEKISKKEITKEKSSLMGEYVFTISYWDATSSKRKVESIYIEIG